MRMKDDHMRNGQLKPAYNVQIAVESEVNVSTPSLLLLYCDKSSKLNLFMLSIIIVAYKFINSFKIKINRHKYIPYI